MLVYGCKWFPPLFVFSSGVFPKNLCFLHSLDESLDELEKPAVHMKNTKIKGRV